MEIKKNGFLWNLAYGWKTQQCYWNEPEQTNLCRFFWRCVLCAIVIWIPLLVFVYGIGSIVAFMGFGAKPVSMKRRRLERMPFEEIDWWPKAKDEDNKIHVMPFVVLLLGIILGSIIYFGIYLFIWRWFLLGIAFANLASFLICFGSLALIVGGNSPLDLPQQ